MKRKSLKIALDKVTRKFVKTRDDYICQRCGNPTSGKGCHWAHIYGRGRGLFMRWDFLNSLVLCAGCHRWAHSQPLDFGEWFAQRFPARFIYLTQNVPNQKGVWMPRKNVLWKYTDDDLEKLLEKKEKLKEIEK